MLSLGGLRQDEKAVRALRVTGLSRVVVLLAHVLPTECREQATGVEVALQQHPDLVFIVDLVGPTPACQPFVFAIAKMLESCPSLSRMMCGWMLQAKREDASRKAASATMAGLAVCPASRRR